MTIKDRLQTYIRYKNMSQKAFLQSINKSLGYIAAFKKGPSAETLSDISRLYPDLNTDWLLTGEGEMLKSTSTTSAEVAGDNNGNVAAINNGTMVNGIVDRVKHFVESIPLGCGSDDNPAAEAFFERRELERRIDELEDEVRELRADLARKNKIIDKFLG